MSNNDMMSRPSRFSSYRSRGTEAFNEDILKNLGISRHSLNRSSKLSVSRFIISSSFVSCAYVVVFCKKLRLRQQYKSAIRKINVMINKMTSFNYKESMDFNFSSVLLHKELIRRTEDDPYYIELQERFTFNGILREMRSFTKEYSNSPILIFTRTFLVFRVLQWVSNKILKSKIFNFFVIFVVILNCFNMSNYTILQRTTSQNLILSFFFIETAIRLIAKGFTGFFKNGWYLIEFIFLMLTIILNSWLKLININFTAFRILGIAHLIDFRPIRNILDGIFSTFNLLADTFFLFMIVIYFFALIGTHVFNGFLYNNCLNPNTGELNNDICGTNSPCVDGFICIRGIQNHNDKLTSFNNIGISWIQVLRVVTLNDWTYLMRSTQIAFSIYSWPYFILLVFIGNFILLNLSLAVMKIKFDSVSKDKAISSNNEVKKYNLKSMKNAGMFKKKKYNLNKNAHDIHLIQNPISGFKSVKISDNKLKLNSNKSLKSPTRSRNKHFTSIISPINKLSIKSSILSNNSRKSSEDIRNRDSKLYESHESLISRISNDLLFELENFQKKARKTKTFKISDIKNIQIPFLEKIILSKRIYKSLSEADVFDHRITEKFEQETKLRNYNIKNTRLPASYVKELYKLYKEADSKGEKIRKAFRVGNLIFNQKCTLKVPIQKNRQFERFKTRRSNKRQSMKTMSIKKITSLDDLTFHDESLNDFAIPDLGFLNYYDFMLMVNKPIPETKKKPLINNSEEYEKIWENDYNKKLRYKRILSIPDIFPYKKFKFYRNKIGALIKSQKIPASNNLSKFINYLQDALNDYNLRKLMGFLAVVNIISLSLEGLIITKDSSIKMEIVFGFIFLGECFTKFIILGLKGSFKSETFRDSIYYLEAFLGVYTVIKCIYFSRGELNILEAITAWRFIQIITILRIFRFLRDVPYMKFILNVIKATFHSFFILAIVMLLFISSYGFIGIDMFSSPKGEVNSIESMRMSFQSFSESFITIFTLITMDDWYSLYVYSYFSKNFNYLVILFFMTLIFIGNFMILNLFIANMLLGFESTDPKKYALSRNQLQNQLIEIDGSDFTISQSLSVNSLSLVEAKGKIDKQTSIVSFTNLKKIRANAHKIREKCRRFLRERSYKALFILILFFSLISTTFETFENSFYHIIADVSNLFIFLSLILDALIRITAFGLSSGENAYLSDTKGIFNALCMTGSGIDFLGNFGKLGSARFKSATFFRSLQLLRIFLEFESLYVVTVAILKSFKGVFNVLLAVFGVWMLFAIIGMHFFRDRFGYCEAPYIMNVGKNECLKTDRQWINHVTNFDTIGQAFITLLAVSTYDRWSEILELAINSEIADIGPTSKNNAWQSYFFFMSFTIIGSWLFSNLIIGVIFKNFFKEEKKGMHPYLTENQTKWLKLLPLIKNSEPERFKAPESYYRYLLYKLVTKRRFSAFMFVVILLNIILLSLNSDTLKYQQIYPYYIILINVIHCIYFGEAILKILSWGAKGYFSQRRHWLEIFIVFFLLIQILISSFTNDEIILRAISIFKLFPFFRIFDYFRNLNNFLNTLLFTIPRMFYLVSFLIIFTFIYSVLGWYLFRDIEKIDIMYDNSGFKNIFYSMFILFQIATAEDWAIIMNDCINPEKCKEGIKDCGSKFAIPYFVIYLIFTNFIVINMFVLILLKTFEDFSISNLNPTIFRKSVSKIKRAWTKVKRTKQKEIEIQNNLKCDTTNFSKFNDSESKTSSKSKIHNIPNIIPTKKPPYKNFSLSKSVDKKKMNTILLEQQKRFSDGNALINIPKNFETKVELDSQNSPTSPSIAKFKFPDPKTSLIINLDSIQDNTEEIKEDIPIYATPKKSTATQFNNKKSNQFSDLCVSEQERSNSLQIKKQSADSDIRTSTFTRIRNNSMIREKINLSKKLLKSMVTSIGQIISSKEINDYFIHMDRIPRFLKILGKPLGLKKNANFKDIGKYLSTFMVVANSQGFTTFHQVIYATMKNNFQSYIDLNTSKKGKEICEKYGNVFQNNLKSQGSKSVINKIFAKKNETLKISSPFQIYIQNYTYFQVWKKYSEVVAIYGKFNRIPTDQSSDDENHNISGGCYYDATTVKNTLLQKWFAPIEEEEEEKF